MKFLSIKEFFYKLNTIGFILLLVPMLAFVFLYYRPGNFEPVVREQVKIYWLLEGVIALFLLILTTVQWIKVTQVKKMKSLIELSKKMDGYAHIFLVRMLSYSACSLLIVAGYYLTGDLYFTGLFILMVIITILQWPMRSTFGRLMDLNANERTMIMTNGDMIQRKAKRTTK